MMVVKSVESFKTSGRWKNWRSMTFWVHVMSGLVMCVCMSDIDINYRCCLIDETSAAVAAQRWSYNIFTRTSSLLLNTISQNVDFCDWNYHTHVIVHRSVCFNNHNRYILISQPSITRRSATAEITRVDDWPIISVWQPHAISSQTLYPQNYILALDSRRLSLLISNN